MPQIVIEGSDNSGKSTLAALMVREFAFSVCVSEGKEKWPGEINERIKRYNKADLAEQRWTIYDRHPCVSQPIYSKFNNTSPVDEELLNYFYANEPLLIYCVDRGRGLSGHVEKERDTPEHLATISANHERIAAEYLSWAIAHAHIWYRVSDDMNLICCLARGAINGRIL